MVRRASFRMFRKGSPAFQSPLSSLNDGTFTCSNALTLSSQPLKCSSFSSYCFYCAYLWWIAYARSWPCDIIKWSKPNHLFSPVLLRHSIAFQRTCLLPTPDVYFFDSACTFYNDIQERTETNQAWGNFQQAFQISFLVCVGEMKRLKFSLAVNCCHNWCHLYFIS